MDLLSIHLNIITARKKMKAKLKCTVSLIFLLKLSDHSSLLFSPRISIQKEEVRAVSAPSALGKSADIRAMMNIIETAAGMKFNAVVGNKSSAGTLMEFWAAKMYNKPPRKRKRKFTSAIITLKVIIFF